MRIQGIPTERLRSVEMRQVIWVVTVIDDGSEEDPVPRAEVWGFSSVTDSQNVSGVGVDGTMELAVSAVPSIVTKPQKPREKPLP